ncbi:MAG: M15 family metallopeptidase [bacterium]|nr:M15 family metallopeptidase [bacterium]
MKILFISTILLSGLLMTGCSKPGSNNPVERKFKKAGLIDIHTIDPTIKVKLVNSNKWDNYFSENYYEGLQKAYLQRTVAIKLSKAQKILKKRYPNFSLHIMDAARPYSVSVKMYKKMKGTRFEKYVANPKRGSMHNYGAAVDITIVNEKEEIIDMGMIPFYKTKVGVIISYLLHKGKKLTKTQSANRKLLKNVMISAGFKPLSFEWWHFNGYSKSYIRKTYSMIK